MKIPVYFCDFWKWNLPDTPGGRCFIWDCISDLCELADPQRAEIIIHGNYGQEVRHWPKKKKIYHTQEPYGKYPLDAGLRTEADICFSYDPDGPRNVRVPNWLNYLVDGGRAAESVFPDISPELDYMRPAAVAPAGVFRHRAGFCLAMVSNPACRARNAIMDALAERNLLASGGAWMNNQGKRIHKYREAGHYKYILAYENCRQPGYVTEKIVDAVNYGGIPVWWGALQTDFNPARMLDRSRFPDDAALIARMEYLADHPAEYARIVSEPLFREDPRPLIRARIRAAVLSLQ